GPGAAEKRLVKLIIDTIEPHSWEKAGGKGTIEFFPASSTLVIKQPPVIHELIEEWLQALRRTRDLEVAVELRTLHVSAAVMEKIAGAMNFNIDDVAKNDLFSPMYSSWPLMNAWLRPRVIEAGPPKVSLTDAQLRLLMEIAQQDPLTAAIQSPRSIL